MKKSTKRKFKPVASNPLIRRDPGATELPGLIGLFMLGKTGLQEAHIYDMLANADVAARVPKATPEVLVAAQAIKDACATILARPSIGVSGEEMKSLRHNLPITIKFLKNQHQAVVWKAAMESVREFETTGSLRI